MNVHASYAHPDKQASGSPGGNYINTMIASIMLDRYGLGYICMHPEILFSDPCRPASDITSRMYNPNQQETGVPCEPKTLLNRMAEPYRVLDQIFSRYK